MRTRTGTDEPGEYQRHAHCPAVGLRPAHRGRVALFFRIFLAIVAFPPTKQEVRGYAARSAASCHGLATVLECAKAGWSAMSRGLGHVVYFMRCRNARCADRAGHNHEGGGIRASEVRMRPLWQNRATTGL